MGYTHYWRTPKTLDAPKFRQFANDCKQIINYCENELGIDLADGLGENRPVVNSHTVCFNGSESQRLGMWTTTEQILIPWPGKLKEPVADPIAEKTKGHWFAGNVVSQRVAPIDNKTGLGSGSYETFAIDQKREVKDWEKPKNGLYFDFCMTAYRPYDLAVTACLVALKNYFPECEVSSDGELENWADGIRLCAELFDYGYDFDL